jgi:hypothetical protein|tara:strand:- start:263 stop:487 length:225 start_codon:yes stop_codon:yes gene_type:complete
MNVPLSDRHYGQYHESGQPHLADFIQRYEEAEENHKALHDEPQTELPIKMTKRQANALLKRLYNIVYNKESKYA